jgi:serine protease Do
MDRRIRSVARFALLLVPLLACSKGAARQADPVREVVRALEPGPGPDTVFPTAVQQGVAGSRRNAIVTAAQRVSPAVVSIHTVVRQRVVPRTLWEQLMIPPGATQESAGLGSGFIIHENGIVVTNEHVVRGADRIRVTLPDGREYDASVVGTDEINDLAVLRIRFPEGRTEKLPVAPLGSSDDLMIGEWVLAIGNPLGFYLANTEPTVTAGVVSAVGRNIRPVGDQEQRGYYLDMIQTDASINPGNSGGPLVNALGQVIGVNSSILSQSGGNEGLGFAIPIERAKRVVRDLLEAGRVRHAWIGVNVEPAGDPDVAGPMRVRIASEVPGSPAARAGLREGMIIASVGDRHVRTPLDWLAALLRTDVGSPLTIHVADGSGTRDYRVSPTDLPSMSAQRVRALRDLQLVTVTPAIRAERSLASDRGALVVSLSDQARAVGLQEGDVILQINRAPVRSAEDAARILGQLAGNTAVIFFERGGQVGSTQVGIG